LYIILKELFLRNYFVIYFYFGFVGFYHVFCYSVFLGLFLIWWTSLSVQFRYPWYITETTTTNHLNYLIRSIIWNDWSADEIMMLGHI